MSSCRRSDIDWGSPKQHLPEGLCYIFAEDAPRIEGFKLPHGVTKKWFTKRRCQILAINNMFTHVPYKVDESSLRRSGDPPLSRTEVKAKTQFVHSRASEFRRKSGVFLSRRCADPVPGATISVLTKAKKFTVDQWFFGVFGEINKRTLKFSPPIDATLNGEEMAAIEDVVAPIYDLPKPQDVHSSYRELLEEYGVALPAFDEWLNENRTVRQRFFPEKRKREDSTRYRGTEKKTLVKAKAKKKAKDERRRKTGRPPKHTNNELFVSDSDSESGHTESSEERLKKRKRQPKISKRKERQHSSSVDSEKQATMEATKQEAEKARPRITLPPIQMIDLTGSARPPAQEHPTPAKPLESEPQYRPFLQNAPPTTATPRPFQQPFNPWGTTNQDPRSQTGYLNPFLPTPSPAFAHSSAPTHNNLNTPFGGDAPMFAPPSIYSPTPTRPLPHGLPTTALLNDESQALWHLTNNATQQQGFFMVGGKKYRFEVEQ